MRTQVGHRTGAWVVAFAFTAVMAMSALPTPLYVLYQQRDGFSTLMITVVFAAYALGVMASLFLLGHSSDWLGRRRALAPAVALAAASAVVFLVWPALPGLLVARVMSGVAVGVATATATAYLAELYAARRGQSARRAQVVSTAANLGGIGTGPLIAGLLAEYFARPLSLPFETFVIVLAAGSLALLLVPETKQRPAQRPRYRPQRISVPADARGRFVAASSGAAIAFAAFGLFTALAPSFLAGTLGHGSRALAGAAAFAVFAAAALGQTLTARRSTRELLIGGMGAMALGLSVVTLAVWLPSPSLVLFLAGGVLTGAGGGLLFKGTIGTVSGLASDHNRAEVLAGFFLISYAGLALPVVGLGLLTQVLSPRSTLLIFAAVVLVGLAGAGRFLLAPRDRAAA